MLKFLIGAVIVGALAFGGWELYLTYKEKGEGPATPATPVVADNTPLPGMPSAMEPAYEGAKKQGAVGLKYFLTKYGKAIKDPRLASIELDYVVLVASKDLAEARKVFAGVKARTSPDSPVYERVKQLEKTYE